MRKSTILSCVVNPFLVLKGTVKLFPEWLFCFTFSPAMYESSSFFTSLSVFGVIIFILAILIGM